MEKEELEFAKYYHRKIRPEMMEVVDAQTLVFDKDSYAFFSASSGLISPFTINS